VTVHLDRARVLLDQGRYDLGERELRQALVVEPDDAHAQALLALCLSHLERYYEATAAAQEAIRLAPDLAFAHHVLASVLADRQRPDEAREVVEEAIRLEPWHPGHYSLLAGVLGQQGRWDDALAAAEQGLALDPEHLGCLNMRAMALVQRGRCDEAAATIAEALAQAPDNTFTHANEGWACLHRGNSKQALTHFREALRLDPTLDWARAGMVEALKARYPVYGLMLRYFLWMNRLDPRVRWGVLLGGWFLARFLGPLIVVYWIFAYLTWTADPLFNLLLRLHPDGRHALSREQVVASNWVGASALLALLSLVALVVTRQPWLGGAFIVFAALVIPLAGTFQCAPGWPRRAMAGYTLALFALGVGSLILQAVPSLRFALSLPRTAGETLFAITLLGVFLGTIVANVLIGMRPRL
jgi:tetratricopeptide (TPR) repeat protein